MNMKSLSKLFSTTFERQPPKGFDPSETELGGWSINDIDSSSNNDDEDYFKEELK